MHTTHLPAIVTKPATTPSGLPRYAVDLVLLAISLGVLAGALWSASPRPAARPAAAAPIVAAARH